jgi:hypothetical protein
MPSSTATPSATFTPTSTIESPKSGGDGCTIGGGADGRSSLAVVGVALAFLLRRFRRPSAGDRGDVRTTWTS